MQANRGPGSIVKTEALIQKLRVTTSGEEVWRTVKKLAAVAPDERPTVVEAFLQYAQTGALLHWRSMILPNAIELIEEGDDSHAPSFRRLLTEGATAYWSVTGLARTLARASYDDLTDFALSERHATDARANAIKVLATLSGQTFTRGLPTDSGKWLLGDLPLAALDAWRSQGYPDGTGFGPPITSGALATPQTEIDLLATRLEAKLRRYREGEQDLANPTNWLVPADGADLRAITKRWSLPERYVEFVTKFSPLSVTIYGKGFGQGLSLYGAGELVKAQDGYSYDPVEVKEIADWNPRHVVIAAHGGDPFVLDLERVTDGDCPVLTASHGQGTWTFERGAPTFSAFLGKLAR
jgi:hypothetical protein